MSRRMTIPLGGLCHVPGSWFQEEQRNATNKDGRAENERTGWRSAKYSGGVSSGSALAGHSAHRASNSGGGEAPSRRRNASGGTASLEA